jgi:hypothetical protein
MWDEKSSLNLLGTAINSLTSRWSNRISGIGASSDSVYEYMLKGYILFGDPDYLEMFNDSYNAIKKYIKHKYGLYFNVYMDNGHYHSTNMDGLTAFFPGLQVLMGDLDNAIHLHQIFTELWRKYHAIPEVYDFHEKNIIADYYLLRPEFIESNYMLYQSTKDPYYLDIGEMVLYDIERLCRTECGYAQLSPLTSYEKENRMESFFISETLKYLYLLFDENNKINTDFSNSVFTTEGHYLNLPDSLYHKKFYENSSELNGNVPTNLKCPKKSYNIENPLLSVEEKLKIFSLVNTEIPEDDKILFEYICLK